jgi:hypothetical protein
MREHEWAVVAEFDAGYVIGRCQVCGQKDLLDVGAFVPDPRQAAASASDVRSVSASA